MDDTLYLERDYVRSGFGAVAHQVAATIDPNSEQRVFRYLWSQFENGVRGDTFDRLRQEMSTVAQAFQTADLVAIYRAHEPRIDAISEMTKIVGECRRLGLKTGLLSDGPLAVQRAKLAALGVGALMDAVVLTDALGRSNWKPAPAGFESLERQLGLGGSELAYVGDNPKKDFVAPNARGWASVRMILAGQLHERLDPPSADAAPAHQVTSPGALRAWIDAQLRE